MEIGNCTWKFQFQCPRHWDGLRPTADPKIRACDACLQNVYLCDNEQDVARRSAAGQCVALSFREDEGPELMGLLIDRFD